MPCLKRTTILLWRE